MNTTQYGEPWRVVSHSWSDSSIYAGDRFIISHSIDNEDTTEENQNEREDEQTALLQRICDDHNALSGVSSPQAALDGARKALEEIAGGCRLTTRTGGGAQRSLSAHDMQNIAADALELLGGSKP